MDQAAEPVAATDPVEFDHVGPGFVGVRSRLAERRPVGPKNSIPAKKRRLTGGLLSELTRILSRLCYHLSWSQLT
jgi:hypothetical protein